MRLNHIYIVALSLAVSAVPLHAVDINVYNGGFTSGGDGWQENSGNAAAFNFAYPTTGGNPGGHGIIDNTTGGSWGIWVANFGAEELLSNLNLEAGETYIFKQDMKLLSGDSIGGLKIDFVNGADANGSTGDMQLDLIGDGSTWETYEFQVTIPLNTTGIKTVPLWGAGSEVAYDNIRIDNTALVTSDGILDADFELSDGVNWETNSGGGTFNFSFPSSEGNPTGHGVIDNTAGGGWGIFVTNNGAIIPIEELGLVAGEAGKAYIFKQDMKILSGGSIGGMKVDFFQGGLSSDSTGDIFPDLIGDGSTWETYEFQIPIPANTTGLKIVPLWGANSSVGYDNILVVSTPDDVEEPPEITEIPNAGFEEGADTWDSAGEPNTAFTFEQSGGNPGGHAVMTNNGNGFGVLVSNEGNRIPLEGLGLAPGRTFRFSQDMKLLSGGEVGGLKIEFYNGATARGNTGDLRAPLIGDGSTWETYFYDVSIPLNVDSLKVVPLWGSGSSVAIDNIGFSTNALPTPPILNADFENGGSNWSFFAGDTNAQGLNSNLVYRATGGNPGGYAEIENFNSWAVLIANQEQVIPVEFMGISEPGEYEFKMDMKIFAGNNIGGLKIEYFTNGRIDGASDFDSGDVFPILIGNGSTWETYTFNFFIGADITGIKVVPLWGADSTVGFDNVLTPSGSSSGYEGWIAGFPNVGAQLGFNDDPDNDGSPNGLENFLGTDPSVGSTALLAGVVNEGNFGSFVFSHPQNSSPADDISAPIYEWSPDMVNYYEGGEVSPAGLAVLFGIAENTPSEGITQVSANLSGPLAEKLFFRVRVEPSN